MNTSSILSLLRNHVLYRLQDKASGTVQGFAFVRNGQDSPENLKDINFLPVGDDFINQAVAEGRERPATSVPIITDHEEEGKRSFLTPESAYEQEPPTDSVMDILDTATDLNLSQASSTNETTIEECLSQSSHTSPLLLPRQTLSEQDDAPSGKSLSLYSSTDGISSSCSTSNLHGQAKSENILPEQLSENIKTEVKESDESASVSRITVASLAAEVVSSLRSKLEENNNPGSEGKKISRHRAMNGKSSPALSEETVKYFESRRNAKKEMSEEVFAKLHKPFQLGWRRECVVVRGCEVSSVYYVTPPQPGVPSRRIRYPSEIAKYLEETRDSTLSMENFSLRRKNKFLGFGPGHEIVRNPFQADTVKTGWKYDNFYEIVTNDDEKRFKCLLCGSTFTQKGNFGRHVKVYHEPDETCDKCGNDFRPIHIQVHRVHCNGGSEDIVSVDKTAMKRKGEKVLAETPSKVMKEDKVDDEKSVDNVPDNNNPSKPVARKSSPVSTMSNTESYLISAKDDSNKNPDEGLENKTVEYDTFKLPVSDALENSNFNPVEHTGEQPQPVKLGSSAPVLAERVLHREMPCMAPGVVEPRPMATLVMVSAEGTRVRMQVKVQVKLVKGMKKFGLRMGVSYESLRFLLDGKELTGEELAAGLDGAEILVQRRFVEQEKRGEC